MTWATLSPTAERDILAIIEWIGDGEVVREKTEADSAVEEYIQSDRTCSFWSSLSLAELAEAQGIAPIDDLEELAALWQQDSDSHELLDHILAERSARRRLVGSDPGQ